MLTTFTTHCPLNLEIFVNVNGKFRSAKFTFPVIYGNKGVSTFSTDSVDMVNALKKHPDFNVVFFLKDEPKIIEVVEEFKPKTIEDELGNAENAIIVESVTTKGMAIAYIQGMYGESFTATTVEDMKREAAQKWNTLFTKWGK
jgi:hypothetical protein